MDLPKGPRWGGSNYTFGAANWTILRDAVLRAGSPDKGVFCVAGVQSIA